MQSRCRLAGYSTPCTQHWPRHPHSDIIRSPSQRTSRRPPTGRGSHPATPTRPTLVQRQRRCPGRGQARRCGLQVPVTITVNGQRYERQVEPRLLLVHFLREVIGLTGTKVGCDTSQCGSCTVLVDGVSMKSCTALAVQADGADVTTIEGLANGSEMHPLQDAYWEKHGLQCGFCTPGMIMASHELLRTNPNPTDEQIRHGLEGNMCRCTGYQNIVRAVRHAAGTQAGER
ncbi:MAG: hypothetical protein CL477_13620 [Acidobacteria bacterium]|nr:hypothetical protein [Acidobacteriota bacterium]